MVRRSGKLKIPALVISSLGPCVFLLFLKFGGGTAGGADRDRNLTNFSAVGHTSISSLEREETVQNPTPSLSDDDIDKKSIENITHMYPRELHSDASVEYDTSSDISKYDDSFVVSTQLVMRLAQCRANCLDKFGGAVSPASHQLSLESKVDSSISTCWHTCHFLEEEGRTNQDGNEFQRPNVICSLSSKLCLRGCQEACGFHFHQHQNLRSSLSFSSSFGGRGGGLRFLPVMAIPVEPSLSITSVGSNGSLIQWPIPTSTNPMHNDQQQMHLVYALVQPSSSSSWEVVGEQTVTNEMTVQGVDNPMTLRLLAVNSHGLAHVFSHYRCHEGGDNGTTMEEKEKDLWHLQLNSLVHQKFLVVTEVRWDVPQQEFIALYSTNPKQRKRRRRNVFKLKNTDDQERFVVGTEQGLNNVPGNDGQGKGANFLLTWEVYGGLVRGHLVTEMNVVTVSLWPDTSYIFQVGLIDESLLALNKGESSITQMESLLSSGGELPVRIKSNTLSINTSLALYPLVKKSVQGERKRSTNELSPPLPNNEVEQNQTRPLEKVRKPSSSLCNWKVHQHYQVHAPTDDELRACILIWGILIVCLIIIFLMFLYFSVAVYLAMRQQIYFQKLHTTCSVSSIYNRQFYRLRKNIFKKNGHGRNKAAPSSAVELLNFSDSSSSSGSEDEEMHPVDFE